MNKVFTFTHCCSVSDRVHLKPEVLLNNRSIPLTYLRRMLTESNEYRRQSLT